MPNKGTLRRAVWRNVLLAVLGGIVVLAAALLVSTRTAMAETAHMLSSTTEYVKEQCNRFAKIDLASETKSLMRVIESGKQIAHEIADDRALGREQALDVYVRDSYVSGVYLLDGDGGIDAQYHSESAPPDELDEALETRALLDTALHPEKRYAERFRCADGSELDVAATARKDAAGIVVAYYHTPASYKNSFSLSAAALLDGYTVEKGGTIAIGSGDTIVASNDLSLIGAKTDDVPILKALSLLSDGEAQMYSAPRDHSVSHDFGLMKRGRDFYIYGYVSEWDMFGNTPHALLYTLLVYIFLLTVIHTVYWQLAQRYRERQVRAQAEYTDSLRQKNEQLSIAIENAARANAAKSGFLSRMSHDIRTPLNGILGLLRISDMHEDDPVLLAENRRKIKIAANHLLSLVNDVLNMSTRPSLRMSVSVLATSCRTSPASSSGAPRRAASHGTVPMKGQSCRIRMSTAARCTCGRSFSTSTATASNTTGPADGSPPSWICWKRATAAAPTAGRFRTPASAWAKPIWTIFSRRSPRRKTTPAAYTTARVSA